MGKIYVISDLHFGHTNMALHRGFDSVEEHDQTIIDNWNRQVNKGDTVWILGDITMEKKTLYWKLGELKGHKKVVLGNHDMPQPSHNKTLLEYVSAVAGAVINKSKGYIMTHIPVHPSELKRFSCCVHGHIHENDIRRTFLGIKLWKDPRYINVSCEAVNYTPVLLEKILSK